MRVRRIFSFLLFAKSLINVVIWVYSHSVGMGSEATLHPDLIKILSYAAASIPDVVLFTNGSRLNAESVNSIINGITRVCISLDAASEETYKVIRGGDLEKVEEVIAIYE